MFLAEKQYFFARKQHCNFERRMITYKVYTYRMFNDHQYVKNY